MKKTRRILAITALLLLAAMLFSSCGVNYAKADMSKYVSIEESGYKGITLSSAINKTIVRPETVRQTILSTLRTKLTDSTPDKSGLVQKYDEVVLHTFAVDKDGDIVMSTLVWDDETSSLGEGELLMIGYGVNTGHLETVEEKLYDETDPANPIPADIGKHLLNFIDEKNNVGAVVPDGAYIFVKYSSLSEGNVAGESSSTSVATINTSLYLPQEGDESYVQGQNNYKEAISLALAKINSQNVGTTNHDGVNFGGITIRIYPTETPDSEMSTETDDSKVNLKYNIDFDNANGTAYDKGTITVTLKGAAYLADGNVGAGTEGTGTENIKTEPIVIEEYTFPETETRTYTKNGTKTSLAGVTVKMYLYVTGKYSYEIPEYDNPETEEEIAALKTAIAEKGKFTTDKTDIDEIKKAYEEHVRYTLEKDYIESAEHAALEAIWSAVLANGTVLKRSKYDEYARVRTIIDNIKAYYSASSTYLIVDRGAFSSTGFSFGTGYAIGTPEQSKQYKNYKEYAIDIYKQEGYTVTDFAQLKDILYAEAQLTIKEMMMAYLMADLLGIEMDDATYTQRRDADFAEWLKENEKDLKEEYGGKMPYISVEDYEDSFGGREELRSAYLLDEVKHALYEMNKDKVVYNEQYPTTAAGQ